jgi:hypothetical protein
VKVVQASLSADMSYLALTIWRPNSPSEGSAQDSKGAAPGPYEAFVLRICAAPPPAPLNTPGEAELIKSPKAQLRALARIMQGRDSGMVLVAGGGGARFTGAAAVQWLLQREPSLRLTQDRGRAVELGRSLLAGNFISAVVGDTFADDSTLLYSVNSDTAAGSLTDSDSESGTHTGGGSINGDVTGLVDGSPAGSPGSFGPNDHRLAELGDALLLDKLQRRRERRKTSGRKRASSSAAAAAVAALPP